MTFDRRSLLIAGGATLLGSALPIQSMAQQAVASRKKGLAGAAPVSSALRTSWYYDWGIDPATKGMPATDPSIRFVPMLWGLGKWTDATLARLRQDRLPVLLGFNEPDNHKQSNLTVEQALDAWPKLAGIADELVAPSCVQPHQEWMQRFVEGADQRGLQFDSVGFHYYRSANPDDFIGLLTRVHDMYRKPVWVTEFACADWSAQGERRNRYTERDVVRFIETVCPFMERTPWIHGYAWYPWGTAGAAGDPFSASAFFTSDGSLTDVGEAYAAI